MWSFPETNQDTSMIYSATPHIMSYWDPDKDHYDNRAIWLIVWAHISSTRVEEKEGNEYAEMFVMLDALIEGVRSGLFAILLMCKDAFMYQDIYQIYDHCEISQIRFQVSTVYDVHRRL